MFLAATQTGTLSSTDSRNLVVEASLRDNCRCSVQSSCVPIVPPLGRLKIFDSTDRPSGSSVTTPSGRRASLLNSSTVRLIRPRARRSSASSRPVMALEISARPSPYISRKRSLQKTTRFCALVIITPWLSVLSAEPMNALRRNCALLALRNAVRIQIPIATRKETAAIPPSRNSHTELELSSPIWPAGTKPAEGAAAHASPHGAAVASRQTRACTGIEFFRSACRFLSAITHPRFADAVSGLTGLDRVNDCPYNSKMRPKLRQLA